MIFTGLLMFTALGAAAGAINVTRIDNLGKTMFAKFNENAVTFQTGVLIRVDDNDFHFGNLTNPLGLSCTEGYMRPVVLNAVRPSLRRNIYRMQVVIHNMTVFYKDCRVFEESGMFMGETMKTPCFVKIDISALIGWARISSIEQKKGSCQNTINMDLDDDITGSGIVRVFFLRSSTLYTLSLVLDNEWTKKIQEAISRTSLIFLSDYSECMNLPVVKSEVCAPKYENDGKGANFTDDNTSLLAIDDDYDDEYDDDYDEEISSTTSPGHQSGTTFNDSRMIFSALNVTAISKQTDTTGTTPLG